MKTIKVKKNDYISASQINSFIERRDQYVRNYILGEKWQSNAYFGRGNAVEEGVNLVIDGMEVTQAAEAAVTYYQQYCKIEGLSRREAAKVSEDDVRKSVMAAGVFYKNELGATSAVQKQEKIVLNLDGVKKPIIGYCDYIFPGSGPVRDLKTASKTPSKLSEPYKLQGTIYHLATGKPVFFDYIVSLKTKCEPKSIRLEDDDIVKFKEIIIAAANALENLWAIVPDEIDEDYIDAFNSLAFPNLYGMWNPDEKEDAIRRWVKK